VFLLKTKMSLKTNRRMKKQVKQKFKLFSFFLLFCIVFALIFSLSVSLKHLFSESSLFAVKRISYNLGADSGITGKELKDLLKAEGENIFSLSLKGISSRLERHYRQYKQVVVRRVFPDSLSLNFIKREPFFQVNISGRYSLADRDCIIISNPAKKPFAGEITVSVVFPRGLKVHLGDKLSLPYSENILDLIEELKKQSFLDSYKITSLSAFAKNDIWFDLNGIEIRIGSGDYAEKLSRLKGLIIPRLKDDLDKIEYIDLRFAEYTFKIKH